MQIFLTILTGVSVYVLGQLVIKLIIDPLVGFKEVQGKISQFFLRYQGQLLAARGEEKIIDNAFNLASELLAKKNSIVMYKLISSWFNLPSEQDVLNASRNLNLVGNLLQEKAGSSNNSIQVQVSMAEVAGALRVATTYSS